MGMRCGYQGRQRHRNSCAKREADTLSKVTSKRTNRRMLLAMVFDGLLAHGLSTC